jgi:hypothetical protein
MSGIIPGAAGAEDLMLAQISGPATYPQLASRPVIPSAVDRGDGNKIANAMINLLSGTGDRLTGGADILGLVYLTVG